MTTTPDATKLDALTPETLDDIESKAKAASDLPWRTVLRGLFYLGSPPPEDDRDGALIARLDPATVLALVAECRELRRLRSELLEWKSLARSIVAAEEAGDVKFRQCAWSSEWSAEFLRLARGAKECT